MASGVMDLGPNTANGSASILNPFSNSYTIDDFTWGNQASNVPIGPFGIVATGGAGGGIFTQGNLPATATQAGRIGLQPIGLGTTNNNTAFGCIYSDGLMMYAGQATISTLDFGFYVPTASDGTNTYVMELGFRNVVALGSASNSMVIRYDSAISPNWACYTSNNNTGTLVDSGQAVVGASYYNGRIIITATAVDYYIASPNGAYTHIGQATTNLPSASQSSYFGMIIYKNATFAVNRFMVIDWVSLTISGLNR